MMGLGPYRGREERASHTEGGGLDCRSEKSARAAYQFIQGTKRRRSPMASWTRPSAWRPGSSRSSTAGPARLQASISARPADHQRDDILAHPLRQPASWRYWSPRDGRARPLGRDEFRSVSTGFLGAANDLVPPPPDLWMRQAYNLVRRI